MALVFGNRERLTTIGKINWLFAEWCDYSEAGDQAELTISRSQGRDIVKGKANNKLICGGTLEDAERQLAQAVRKAINDYGQRALKAAQAKKTAMYLTNRLANGSFSIVFTTPAPRGGSLRVEVEVNGRTSWPTQEQAMNALKALYAPGK